jgi:hypothetical protein
MGGPEGGADGAGVCGSGAITDCTISGNSVDASAGHGDGICGSGTITGCTISGNTVAVTDGSGTGGGIEWDGTITGCTISGNTVVVFDSFSIGYGGGIAGSGTIIDCTISGNSTSGSNNRGGGGIYGDPLLTVINSTISNNAAPGASGGGLSGGGTLKNTIVAGNQAASSPDVAGTLTSQGHNLIGDGTGGSGYDPTDLVGTSGNPIDPLLGPLQDNGGPTQTMALLAGSPAIDAGDNTDAPATDQRGFPRIVGGTIDIGAFEVQPAGQTTHLSIQAPATITAGTPFAITVSVLDDFGQPVTGYTGTVHFVASNGATADYPFTADEMGRHVFSNLVLRRAGTYTVAGADTANALITGSTTFTVTPAAAAHIAFSVPGSITAGVPFSITVTVQDAYGNTVTDYMGTVHFTLTGPAMAQADYTFTASDMGSHTFTYVVLSQAGDYTLTGMDQEDPNISGSTLFTVSGPFEP